MMELYDALESKLTNPHTSQGAKLVELILYVRFCGFDVYPSNVDLRHLLTFLPPSLTRIKPGLRDGKFHGRIPESSVDRLALRVGYVRRIC